MSIRFLLFLSISFCFSFQLSCSPDANREFVVHREICDASAAIALDPSRFVVANDEDNILRIYQNDKNAGPVGSVDLAAFLDIDGNREADIEGAARAANRIYWITSHGRNKKGKHRPGRHGFFATDIVANSGRISLVPAGLPYKDLVKALAGTPQFEEFNFESASQKAPTDYAALNIEGLCATPDGRLLIGFRNPVPAGMALIIALQNPDDVIAGETAVFGEAIKLSLNNMGIRSIQYVQPLEKYLIVAGPYDGGGVSKLYVWSGDPGDAPGLVEGADFTGFNPEAIIAYGSRPGSIQLLSDDGSMEVSGEECKEAKKDSRYFRSFWVKL